MTRLHAVILSIILIAIIAAAFIISQPRSYATCEINHSHYAGFNSPANIRHIISRDCQ